MEFALITMVLQHSLSSCLVIQGTLSFLLRDVLTILYLIIILIYFLMVGDHCYMIDDFFGSIIQIIFVYLRQVLASKVRLLVEFLKMSFQTIWLKFQGRTVSWRYSEILQKSEENNRIGRTSSKTGHLCLRLGSEGPGTG